MRYALKFAYDGTRFEGYARQPGKTTVEGEILRAMKKLGIADELRSASRTDRGVSAAGNVIAIDTNFKPKAIIPALNSELEGIFFHSQAVVPEDFNPRHAEQRWYRYVLPRDGTPPTKELKKATKLFLGEHDFRQFSKKDTGNENTLLVIDSIEFTESGDFLFIDIKAQRFLWELVRRMLAAILDVANGKLEPALVKEMLTGVAPHPKGLKPLAPEFLVLMDVSYGIEFENSNDKEKYFNDLSNNLRLRSEIMGQISTQLEQRPQ
jgi:tRNA pseudouridine38-40 synthase